MHNTKTIDWFTTITARRRGNHSSTCCSTGLYWRFVFVPFYSVACVEAMSKRKREEPA